MSKQPTMKKVIKVMTTATLMGGVVAPIVAPMTADAANSTNLVDKVLHVDSDYTTPAGAEANHIIIKEKDVDFATNDTFRLTLPAGVKWIDTEYEGKTFTGENNEKFEVVQVTDQDLELKISNVGNGEISIPMFFEVDGAEGELKVTLDAKGSTLTSGQYTFAVVSNGDTATTISEVKTIGDGDAIGTIRIDELALGAMEAGKVTLTLPTNYAWKGTPTASFGKAEVDSNNDRKVTITVNAEDLSKEKLNTLYISGLAIDADKDAAYGDIEVQVSGDGITDQDIVVAKYADYSSELSLEDEAPTLFAGRNYDEADASFDKDDFETAEILIKEDVAGSWLANRDVQIEFPSWVKVVGVDVTSVKNFKEADAEATLQAAFDKEVVKGDSNEIELSSLPAGDGKREMKVKFYVSTKADAQGDITAKFSGKAGIDGELVVAKAVTPVNVDIAKTNVKTGIKNQAIGNITLTEAVKGALIEDGKVELRLTDGIKFSEKPEVKVVEGNVDIDEDSISYDNGVLSFTIDSESTRASKIQISGVKLDLDRAVPQGDIEAEVGGTALVANADTEGSIDGGMFDKDYVVKKAIATVVTPAEGNARVGDVVFTVGKTTYTEAGVEQAMDVAPFIEASRTYLPVRYVAKSIGIEGSNILWDEATRQVTIIKDGQIAQLTIGSNILTLNGAKITMDTKAQVKDGRTVLPLRAVATALGANVAWNEADQTVTVK